MDEQKVAPSSLPEKRYPCFAIRDSVYTLTILPGKDYVFYTLPVCPSRTGTGRKAEASPANENKLLGRGNAQLDK
jgi:hypothetical protein